VPLKRSLAESVGTRFKSSVPFSPNRVTIDHKDRHAAAEVRQSAPNEKAGMVLLRSAPNWGLILPIVDQLSGDA
jgi:hypothetical protein